MHCMKKKHKKGNARVLYWRWVEAALEVGHYHYKASDDPPRKLSSLPPPVHESFVTSLDRNRRHLLYYSGRQTECCQRVSVHLTEAGIR